MIFKYRAVTPDTVKYGISNFTEIGVFMYDSLPSVVTEGKPKLAVMMKSFWPWNCLMLHTMQSWSGMYRTVPMEVLKEGESTSEGTGMWISTLLATLRDLNCDFALIMYSMREREMPGSTTASTQIRGFT